VSFLLAAIAAMAAINPVRLKMALPDADRRRVAVAAGLLTLGVMAALALLSGPLLDAINVSSSSSIIAAGISLVVIGARDTLVAPTKFGELPDWPLVVGVPVFFPTMFTPAVALLAIAAGADRGVAVGFAAVAVGVVASVVVSLALSRTSRLGTGGGLRAIASMFGLMTVAIGALVATRGVMSI